MPTVPSKTLLTQGMGPTHVPSTHLGTVTLTLWLTPPDETLFPSPSPAVRITRR